MRNSPARHGQHPKTSASPNADNQATPISVREKKPDVFLRVGLQISDGIIKNLSATRLEKPFLFKKSFFYSSSPGNRAGG